MSMLFGRRICSRFQQNQKDKRSEMLSGIYTHSRHAKARDRGRRWRSQPVMFSQKLLWNQGVLVTPWVMETWMFFCSHQLLCAYIVCKHVANNKRDTLCTRLCSFWWFVLTMFFLPRPLFSPRCLQCWQHSDSIWCLKRNIYPTLISNVKKKYLNVPMIEISQE